MHLRHNNLVQRICSILLLMPVAVVALLWLPGDVQFAIVSGFGVLALSEWFRMDSALSRNRFIACIVLLSLGAFVGYFFFNKAGMSGLFVGLMTYSIGSVIGQCEQRTLVQAFGTVYITFGMMALASLVAYEPKFLTLMLLAAVWGTDMGAYAVGSLIGGPRLAPHISPNKTWSGFIGGAVVGSLVCLSFLLWWGLDALYTPFAWVLALVLPLVSHGGDLLESLAKRFYDVKDSGSLIPGHGGVLDRLDSLLAAAIVFHLLKGLFLNA